MSDPNRPDHPVSRLIRIVEEEDVRTWQAKDPETKAEFDTFYDLRIVPLEIQRNIRRKHTTREFIRGQRVENTDTGPVTDDLLDYAIVGWRGVTGRRRHASTGEITDIDLPCERAHKLKQPEWVKAEIIRMCVGRELGEIGEEVRPLAPSGSSTI